ncbi:MAG: NAD-dependent epimerase/dehydratase family protein [Candidatus Obscuribacterales bacterium]|nr:NAD-dependent epimerase/dehydratase family protein [Candidatus Obscuribacterales bacterium]
MVETILVTGGAGFLGSAVAIRLKTDYPKARVIAADNLRRRGSEHNILRLQKHAIQFMHADVRMLDDFNLPAVDLIVECSAEPSALAGRDGDARYVIDTNCGGVINCLELARRTKAALLFISSSRVYPYDSLNALPLAVKPERFTLESGASQLPGLTEEGITTDFPLPGRRTLYGASKLAAELFVQEFAEIYDIPSLILRLGVIAGPWQMGKIDQGVVALWVARHISGGQLDYIGYDGQGRQVRDILHVEDAVELIVKTAPVLRQHRGSVFNAGGGLTVSVSLAELTALCQAVTGNSLAIGSVTDNRPGDVPWYITDNTAITAAFGWRPQRSARDIIVDTAEWLKANQTILSSLRG